MHIVFCYFSTYSPATEMHFVRRFSKALILLLKNYCTWFLARNFMSFHEFFQFRKQLEVTWSQYSASDHTSAQALAVIQNAGLNYSVTHRIRHSYSYCMANGWLEDKEKQHSSVSESELWRNAGPGAFQLQVSMLKSDKIWCAYLVVNCVSLQTFWTHPWPETRVLVHTLCQTFKKCDRGARWGKQRKVRKETQRFDKSHICPVHPRGATPTKVIICCGVPDIVNHAKFHQNLFRGFASRGVEICHLPLLSAMACITG